ncbi:MAG: hypothetical protein Q9225_002174 [Loekoesia sp. 1 TL-2023]
MSGYVRTNHLNDRVEGLGYGVPKPMGEGCSDHSTSDDWASNKAESNFCNGQPKGAGCYSDASALVNLQARTVGDMVTTSTTLGTFLGSIPSITASASTLRSSSPDVQSVSVAAARVSNLVTTATDRSAPPAGATTTTDPYNNPSRPPTDTTDSRGIPIAAVVGGVLGGMLLTGLLIFGIWMCSIRSRRPTTLKKPGHNPTWTKAELGDTCRPEADGTMRDHPELEAGTQPEWEAQIELAELEERRSRHELWGDMGAVELPHTHQSRSENH